MICLHNRGKEVKLEGKTQELSLNPCREQPPGSCLPARAELRPPSPSLGPQPALGARSTPDPHGALMLRV